LRIEIEEIASIIAMDHWNILGYPSEARTVYLEIMKNKLVRAEIVSKYTLIDEYLTVIICHFYFKRPDRNRTFRQLWATKHFRIFNHYIMDDTYLLNKMKIVRAIGEIPPKTRDIIERINALRNAIAHSFFPENRRQYAGHKKVMYQGENVYTRNGIQKFEEDFKVVNNYLLERAFGA